MPLTFKDRVKQAVSAGGTGALTLGAASSGYQALGAGDNALLFPYVIEDGTAWETGYGTYTHSGTSFARTVRQASSTGSALTVTTAAYLFVDVTAEIARCFDAGAQAAVVGGRLSLTTAVPVTSADVAAAANIYFTPYTTNIITLWDNSNRWVPIPYVDTPLALGTLTAVLPYDVFGYLSAGALATELLAWTSDTARATAITLQDGRYCKSGDKTRLYLGTFRTTSTTTTEDSGGGVSTQAGGKRFVWNMYNRVRRWLAVIDTTDSWAYKTGTTRQVQAGAGNKVEFVLGLAVDAVVAQSLSSYYENGSVGAVTAGVGLDTTTAFSGIHTITGFNVGSNSWKGIVGRYNGLPAVGYHYLSWNENGGGVTGTALWLGDNGGNMQAGLQAEIFA